MGSRGDHSRSYVVVVAYKNRPQLRFSNLLENFAEEISHAIPACCQRDTARELFSYENE